MPTQNTIACFIGGRIVHEPVNPGTERVIERAKAGFYRTLATTEGICMPGGRAYVLDGIVHYLDPEAYSYVEKIRTKTRFINAWAKRQVEKRNWEALKKEYAI